MKTIECKFQGIVEHFFVGCDQTKVKYGRYLRSLYPRVKDHGRGKWCVGVKIDVENLDELLKENKSTEEILTGCVEYLNIIKQPKRGRRRKNPPYGNLEVYYNKIPSWEREKKRGSKKKEARVKVLVAPNGTKHLSAVLIIDQIKNKHFWGSGLKK
tara:strand:+ start:822 stop:1289 length:468 start_codon:yes stop_codon:yes gene_type:complete